MLNDMKEAFRKIIDSTPMKEIGAELGRLGVQGQAEIAGALFNGSSYVPYGQGQNSPEATAPEMAMPEQQQQQEMDGREM